MRYSLRPLMWVSFALCVPAVFLTWASLQFLGGWLKWISFAVNLLCFGVLYYTGRTYQRLLRK